MEKFLNIFLISYKETVTHGYIACVLALYKQYRTTKTGFITNLPNFHTNTIHLMALLIICNMFCLLSIHIHN